MTHESTQFVRKAIGTASSHKPVLTMSQNPLMSNEPYIPHVKPQSSGEEAASSYNQPSQQSPSEINRHIEQQPQTLRDILESKKMVIGSGSHKMESADSGRVTLGYF